MMRRLVSRVSHGSSCMIWERRQVDENWQMTRLGWEKIIKSINHVFWYDGSVVESSRL